MRGDQFLVIRRSASVVAPGSMCFPGGGIEGQESETEALQRELREELGAEIQPLRCVWRSTTRWHVELAWWLGELADEAELCPNPAEVESVHWLTADDMRGHAGLLDSNVQFLIALAAGEIALARPK